MIAQDMQTALNDQINEDYRSWYFYRSAADYCHELNLLGLGKWLRDRSEKKLRQAIRLSDFVVERRGHVEARPIDLGNGHWQSPQNILDDALANERHLAESAAQLSDASLKQKDHATHDFLEHMIADQVESEAKVETVRDRLKMVGDSPAGLFMFDRSLG